jgi:hypothetical protein
LNCFDDLGIPRMNQTASIPHEHQGGE